jgi:hypothetical protein
LKQNFVLPNIRASGSLAFSSKTSLFSFLKEDVSHYYFHWVVHDINQLGEFEREYNGACQLEEPLKFSRIIEILKRYNHDQSRARVHRNS